MIDWFSGHLLLPGGLNIRFNGGQVLFIKPDGEVDKTFHKWGQVEGSFSSSFGFRADGDKLYLSGNPTKFLQGHNLFGTEDLPALVVGVLKKAQRLIPGLEGAFDFPAADKWIIEQTHISRVDCTRMLDLGSRSDAVSFVKALSECGHAKRRGRASVTGGTVYWGQHSRRSCLKVYAKGPEYEKPGGRKSETVVNPDLLAYCQGAVRFEVVLRSLELKTLGQHRLSVWWETTCGKLWSRMMEKLDLSENVRLSADFEAKLSRAVRRTYRHFIAGEDVRELLTKSVFYRHRKALLPFGIDIDTCKPRDDQATNIIPFKRVLEGKWMGIPDWALGTDLYFDPKAA